MQAYQRPSIKEEVNEHVDSTYSQNSLTNYLDWPAEIVATYLHSKQVHHDVVQIFLWEEITGRCLPMIDNKQLLDMNIQKIGHRLEVLNVVSNLIKPIKIGRIYHNNIFNDSIHGNIEIHPLLVSVIDTAEFQRLRWIKQLGVSYLVYPGASHNRFEHSLGVAHLAGTFVRSLQNHQPELNITNVDILCVEMAGLCHDLGHGPFSHVFDGQFMPKIEPENRWTHEDASIKMFDYLVDNNEGLKETFSEYGLTERDMIFVKECIHGVQEPYKCLIGRPKEKHFLYEIVANKKTGIDVDKWDYLDRDCHHLGFGVKSTFDYKRFMHFARVVEGSICCRDKEVKSLYDMFQLRANLHRTAYQHKTSQNLENMLVEALIEANEYYLIAGSNGKKYKLSECVNDMKAYCTLTDNIFLEILNSTDPNLKRSRQILRDMQRRHLFKFIGETMLSSSQPVEVQKICDEIVAECIKMYENIDWKIFLIGQIVTFDFGMGEQNPIDNMKFYSKDDPNKLFQIKKNDVSMMLPQNVSEIGFRLYCKSNDHTMCEQAVSGFSAWCQKRNFISSNQIRIF